MDTGNRKETGASDLEALWNRIGDPKDAMGRRRFLQVMAASLALAGGAGCSGRRTDIVPYAHMPENIVPGMPQEYATALLRDGWAVGAIVTTHLGRPTKVEGNPQHPASLGKTDIFMQASVLSLYDPDRSRSVLKQTEPETWEDFRGEALERFGAHARNGGSGLAFLTGTITSLTLLDQMARIFAGMPDARWYRYDPAGREGAEQAALQAFGAPLETAYRFDQARVIVSLDSDFLSDPPANVRSALDFSKGRRLRTRGGAANLNRLYVVEPSPTLTGANADHRVAAAPSRIAVLARALAGALGIGPAAPSGTLEPHLEQWLRAAAADLTGAPGAALVIAGRSQPAEVHVLAHAMNERLGAWGRTAFTLEPVAGHIGGMPGSVADLAAAMDRGEVRSLVILDRNPAYDTPADLDFATRLEKVEWTVHAGLYPDETGYLCRWHLPLSHDMESWGDARAFEGTASIRQPLIHPLFDSRSTIEILSLLLGEAGRPALSILQGFWNGRAAAPDFAGWWSQALRDGVLPGTASPGRPVAVNPGAVGSALDAIGSRNTAGERGLEILFRPDPTVWDGTWANNAWLQELAKPPSGTAWTNAVFMSTNTARDLGVRSEDVVELGRAGRNVVAPVWVMPGHDDRTVSITLGYGRPDAGRVGANLGANAYRLRTSDLPWSAPGAQIRATSDRMPVLLLHARPSQEGRDLLRSAALAAFLQDPEKAIHKEPPPDLNLYPEYLNRGPQWAMTIDLSVCIGCAVCTIACQAENNIPTVGEDQARRGRAMHWIRIDRYFYNDEGNQQFTHGPVPCMHCEKAPCELVCPVGATQHSADGLNEMIYNRCVGTRYCSNNCPYKVRRFNFYRFTKTDDELFWMQRNPDVTVRGRGVMEKCTYCVQRIRRAEIAARIQDRPVRDGEIVPACAQACPTDAIVFGDLFDSRSAVAQTRKEPQDYGMLTELNTRPRTRYLAQVRNLNPSLPEPKT